MTKCTNCKKKQYLELSCKFCAYKFCTNCLMYEVHNCTAYSEMKTSYRKELSDKLISEQVTDIKLQKI